MPLQLSLTGLSASDRYPGVYTEINFAAGSTSGVGPKRALILANKSAAGSGVVETLYGPDTIVPLASEADAITLFGPGSEAHLAFKRFTTVNQTIPVYVMLVASTGAAATGTFTLAGTATTPGAVRLYRNRLDYVDTSFAIGDGYAALGAAMVSAVNSKQDWGFTASFAATGVLTLTAKVAGVRGNTLRFQPTLKGSGITVSVSVSTALSGGTGEDSLTNVLAAIVSERFHYIIPATTDAANLAAIKAQVVSMALPVNGMLQRVVAGSVDSLANTITTAQALNFERVEMLHQYQSDWTPVELASHWVANIMLQEAKISQGGIALNMNLYGATPKTSGLWHVPSPLSNHKPTRSQINAAMNAGITSLRNESNGSSVMVKRVTTRSVTNSVPDYRIADAHRVTVCDEFSDRLKAKFSLEFNNFTASDDLDEDTPAQPGALMPRQVKASTVQLLRQFFDMGCVQQMELTLSELQAFRNTDNPNSFGVVVPLRVIDLADQFLTQINQLR